MPGANVARSLACAESGWASYSLVISTADALCVRDAHCRGARPLDRDRRAWNLVRAPIEALFIRVAPRCLAAPLGN
eukprot:566236-Pyramimonas_sp.AAC.1